MKKIITVFFLLLIGFLLGTQKDGPFHTQATLADSPDGTDSGCTTGDGGCISGGDGGGLSGSDGSGDGDNGGSGGSSSGGCF